MEKRKLCFIINPVSGTTRKKKVAELIAAVFANTAIDYEIRYTEYAGHAKEIAGELSQMENVEIIAVGGDGTINEVINGIGRQKSTLGIIPSGSGNGLARHCKIPLSSAKALELIKKGHRQSIDLMQIEGELSANVSGVGFDALVAHKFQHSKGRGLRSYAKIVMKEFFSYRPQNYHISIDGKTYEKEAFLISLANSSQFGNNAFIAPEASLQDGLIDICILKPFPKLATPLIFEQVMAKTVNNSRYMEIVRGREVEIEFQGNEYHLDGDPRLCEGKIKAILLPAALKLIVPENLKI